MGPFFRPTNTPGLAETEPLHPPIWPHTATQIIFLKRTRALVTPLLKSYS